MKSIRVQIEYIEIKNGERKSAYSCPLSLAFAKHGIRAGITYSHIVITEQVQRGWLYKKIYKYYYTPSLISDWLRVYDRGEDVLPIEFEFILDNPFMVKEG